MGNWNCYDNPSQGPWSFEQEAYWNDREKQRIEDEKYKAYRAECGMQSPRQLQSRSREDSGERKRSRRRIQRNQQVMDEVQDWGEPINEEQSSDAGWCQEVQEQDMVEYEDYEPEDEDRENYAANGWGDDPIF